MMLCYAACAMEKISIKSRYVLQNNRYDKNLKIYFIHKYFINIY